MEPKNFDFFKRWAECVPYLENPLVKEAIDKGIREIVKSYPGINKKIVSDKAPAFYSPTASFDQILEERENEIFSRDKVVVYRDLHHALKIIEDIGEDDYMYLDGVRLVHKDMFSVRYPECSQKCRKEDIWCYIVPDPYKIWNQTFSLALANIMYPNEKWLVVGEKSNKTVVNERRTLKFDILLAAELERE